MKNRLQSLDIVRGLAATSVFLSHLGIPGNQNTWLFTIVNAYQWFFHNFLWCNGGLHAGVVVFIVLSGFCIHMPQARRHETQVNLEYYGKRRFFRIYPVMIVAMVLGLTVWVLNNGLSDNLIINFIFNAVLLHGLLPVPAPLGNAILGTVIVECLLYILYPTGLFLIRKFNWCVLLLFAVGIHFLNSFLLIVSPFDPTWIQRNLYSFILYWWIGAFAVQFTVDHPANNRLSFNGCLIAYCCYFVLSHLIQFKGSHMFKSLVLALLTGYILAVLFRYGMTQNRKIKASFWVSLGEKSYSLYVVHVPILWLQSMLLNIIAVSNPYIIYFSSISVVSIITLIFFYLIEKPSHKFAIETSNKTLQRSC